MSFFRSCALTLMCATVLLVLPAQGRSNARRLMPVLPNCCKTVSDAYIHETVRTCIEQQAHQFRICKHHAYMFITASNNRYCVDPHASWLPARLRKLKHRGIHCQPK